MTKPQKAELPMPPLTAEAFMVWYDQQPDGKRYELYKGQIYEMQGERVTHARAKGALYVALVQEIAKQGLLCEAFVDGLAVRIDDDTSFEPDVFVRCGPPESGETVVIHEATIVIEVLSPTTQHVDVYRKFNGYFRNSAIAHYLIVNSADPSLIHHRRTAEGRIESAHHAGGMLELDPPGLALDLDALFGSSAFAVSPA